MKIWLQTRTTSSADENPPVSLADTGFDQEILKEKSRKTKKLTEIMNLNMSQTRTTNALTSTDSTDENLASTERN